VMILVGSRQDRHSTSFLNTCAPFIAWCWCGVKYKIQTLWNTVMTVIINYIHTDKNYIILSPLSLLLKRPTQNGKHGDPFFLLGCILY
jgi:hypothetical protein